MSLPELILESPVKFRLSLGPLAQALEEVQGILNLVMLYPYLVTTITAICIKKITEVRRYTEAMRTSKNLIITAHKTESIIPLQLLQKL